MQFFPNPTELTSHELLARRNTVIEHQLYQEHKQAALRHLQRCHRPGFDLVSVVESELVDSREEQQLAREELWRIDAELRRRQGEQLPLFTPADLHPTPAPAAA